MSLSLDPITFEVVKHRLWQINDEQGLAIKTISASPIVVEGNDFNVGLFTRDGRVVTAGIGSLVHVSTMGTSIQSMLRLAGQLNDGDAFLTNDPYLGALHQNDVVVASPVFWDGELVMWVGNVLHHPDVGGIDEGSFCINARSLYQEPPRYFLKLVDRGVMSPEVERTFVTNSRLPDAVALDLRAQVGAINVVKQRLAELIQERGIETVLQVMEDSLTYAEQRLKERIAELPDGEWSGECFMDGDRVGSDRIHRVAVRLKKRGDRLIFDYAGSDPQVDAAVNSTYHATFAGTSVPVYTFICGKDIDWNDGLKQCVEVRAPEGTVVNARFPAPVSICTVGFRWLVTVAAAQVVAKMLDCSETYRDRVCPSWNVSSNCSNIFGVTRSGARVGALLSDHRAGGAAARSFADGFNHAGQITSYASYVGNVEGAEWKLPLIYLFRKQLPDSGGPGKYRGGLTAAAAVVAYGADHLILKSTNTAGTDQSNAAGLDGGYPGAGSQASILRHTRLWDLFEQGVVPTGLEDLGGEVQHLPSKADGILMPEDVLVFYAPGGGGFGDPLEREPERVLADVQAGRVSAEGARRHYGVVGSDGQPDLAETARLRSTIIAERLSQGALAPMPLSHVTASGRLGEYLLLERPANGVIRLRCARCGHDYGQIGGPATPMALRRERPLHAAGPWLAARWAGESPNFCLEEWYCPSCGIQFAVDERRAVTGFEEPIERMPVSTQSVQSVPEIR